MADKAFKNRPEDFINKGLKAAVASLPLVGGAAAEFFHFAVADPAQERRDEFLKETFERLVGLEAEVQSVKPEALRDNEQFQATVVQAVRIASTTASAEKKRLLQNAILNSAILNVDEFDRHVFMRLIDDITPSHVVLLSYFANPSAYPAAVEQANRTMAGSRMSLIEAALPDFMRQRDVFSRVSSDLHRLGLADTASLNGMMSGGEGMLTPLATKLGQSFLQFVTAPDDV